MVMRKFYALESVGLVSLKMLEMHRSSDAMLL
jgi:hypothetical protein